MNLPHRDGYIVVHQHDEGAPCVLNPQPGGPKACAYERSPVGRVADRLKGRIGPQAPTPASLAKPKARRHW